MRFLTTDEVDGAEGVARWVDGGQTAVDARVEDVLVAHTVEILSG